MSGLPDLEECLLPSRFIDSDHPEIVERAASLTNADSSPRDNALSLYYWTRDQIRYNPYAVGTEPEDFLASTTLRNGQGWCVTKAILLAALCRAAGIPARVGFADVRNHLSTARLRESMGTDVFYFHGYTSILLDGNWVKATPAFNIELCTKFGLRPLEFDGIHDSLYHEFDVAGNRHMEYIRERGEHLDLPYEEMRDLFVEKYPNMFKSASTEADGLPDSADWDADVDLETKGSAA